MKGYSTLPRAPELGPHQQMQYSVIHRILFSFQGVPPTENTVAMVYCLASQLITNEFYLQWVLNIFIMGKNKQRLC